MPTFINLDTMEYPRYPGDVALDPTANWKLVNQTNMPECNTYEIQEETFPENIDGEWFQKWIVRPMTDKEKFLVDNPPKMYWEINP